MLKPILRRGAPALAAAALLVAAPAFAQSYNYIKPAELKARLQSPASKPLLIDIQVENEFARAHLPGAVATHAYPARSEAERARLKPVLSRILDSKEDVVIVCPGGGSGAKNTVDYLLSQGVPAGKLKILEKGQNGWPYPELVTQK